MGITVDPNENLIYVSDTVNNRIQALDSNGNFITQWGGSGAEAGKLNKPDGIQLDSEKLIYVADRNNHRIQVFDTEGKIVNEWEIYGQPNR